MTFDIPSKNAIYSANSSLYTKGTDPMTLQQDMIFSDGYTYQIATLTPNSETGGYDSYLEVTVQGNGTLGVGHEENQTAKQFTLGQNYPNPYTDETAIPITLEQPSDVTVDLWDLSGKKVATISKKEMKAGEQTITVNLKELGIANSSYVYQIEVVNHQGTFRQCMMMTSGK